MNESGLQPIILSQSCATTSVTKNVGGLAVARNSSPQVDLQGHTMRTVLKCCYGGGGPPYGRQLG